ncbi:MAG: serine/threonine-protein kinase [Candidatus Eisenbacteria bacterium]
MRDKPNESLTRTASTGPSPGGAGGGDGGTGSAERFLPGAIVSERYRIRGRIGVGGMGEVYHADDLRLGVAVALKFLNLASAGDPARLQALVDEVRVARQVAHPNVCRVYDIGEVDGLPFLTMEFIDGEDLASLLRRVGRLPAPKLVELAHQLCAGLAAAHQAGIVHRDLKPANIMVDGRGIARIADFGIAVPAGTPTEGEVSGTPAYMAPEQRRAEAPTPASDFYALGLILYEAAVGARYVERPDGDVALPGIHEALARGISCCLESDPERRPKSALEISALLPGGSLLAATLEAGGTPSPELVAVSGDSRGLSGRAAGGLLALAVAGLAAVIWLAGTAQIVNRVPLTKPPAVLADRARGLLALTAPGVSRRHEAWDFGYDDPAFEAAVAERNGSRYWESLRDRRPPPIVFWYRTSPRVIAPPDLTGNVYADVPPLDVPGMSLVVLDTEGRLLRLRTVPADVETATRSGESPDAGDSAGVALWPALLQMAGFEPDSLRETVPREVPPAYASERRAWVGEWPGGGGRAVRIEGSAFAGEPVDFRAGVPDRAKSVKAMKMSVANSVGAFIELGLYIAAMLASTWLGFRNFRLGRVDKRGATRLASLLAGLDLLGWFAGGPHVASLGGEWNAFLAALGSALRTGATAWVLYVALEPHVRRKIPRSVITWNRLLAGRFLDPVVGRDLLIGVLAGEFFILLFYLDKAIPEWLGLPPVAHLVTPYLTPLSGLGPKLFMVTSILGYGIERSMVYLVVLLVLVLLLRRPAWAGVAFVVLYAGMFSLRAGSPFSLSPALGILGVAGLAVLLTRYGLVSAAVAVGLGWAAQLGPVVSDLSSWAAGATGVLVLMVMAPAIFGAWVGSRGRPAPRRVSPARG